MNDKPKISITGIFVQDPTDKGFTGFFSEIPEAVAEGDTIEEAVSNLLHTLPLALSARKDILDEEKHIEGVSDKFITKSFDFELA